jgi:CHASE3 domain sensor protein
MKGTARLAFDMATAEQGPPAIHMRQVPAETARAADKAHALIQVLRSRSYEEIRQRMYDSPPGSEWWTACKTELDIRNSEQMAAALLATSRVLERMKVSTDKLEKLAETLSRETSEVADQLSHSQQAGRRLEIAIYATIGVSIMQFFFLVFAVFGKR